MKCKCNGYGCTNEAIFFADNGPKCGDSGNCYCEMHFLNRKNLFNDCKCYTCGKPINAIIPGDNNYHRQDVYCSIECAAKAYGYKRIGGGNV